MSNEGSSKGSNNSESSNSSSPNQVHMMRGDIINDKEFTDLTLYGSSATLLSRTGTVRRASAGSKKDPIQNLNFNDEEAEVGSNSMQKNNGRTSPELFLGQQENNNATRYRRSLDSTYRLSLESISEYKTKSSFSTASLYHPASSRECSSMDYSSSSDCTDYAIRSTSADNHATNVVDDNKTLMSPASSYLSWIESVNSEYFGSAVTSAQVADNVDAKVGEWNNFWLNYNSARGKYLSSPYLSAATASGADDAKTGDELSDAKSTCSTQREFTDKNYSLEQIVLSIDEVHEAIKCSQRITEILQNALRRNEHEFDGDSKNDSYYSQQNNSTKDELPVLPVVPPRERSFSYGMDSQELHMQKQQLLKQTPQSSSSSCINTLLNSTGVADMLKRVISKRRDVPSPESEPTPSSISRTTFSDWSSTK